MFVDACFVAMFGISLPERPFFREIAASMGILVLGLRPSVAIMAKLPGSSLPHHSGIYVNGRHGEDSDAIAGCRIIF